VLSIIIVNYNVKYYLEHCLRSVLIACHGIESEIIVIDNASTDGSKDLIPSLFPEIKYECQSENLGFSKANNLGIEISRGDYVLLLNPDTVVPEDCFTTCVQFMKDKPDCGGLGVKMIDGKGHFLPESKRGLPTPSAAFFKMSGLARLFPKSESIGRYHLGYLDHEKNHEIEILSGAFMMMRKEALTKAGLLDEDFFMYGEDIDLSYRIIKAGYKNYYLADTSIIHYKGESTKKGSVNYVFIFYRAMVIFAKKHFEKGQASILGFFINSAIYLRAAVAIGRRAIGHGWQLLLDYAFLFVAFFFVKNWYSKFADKDFDLPFTIPFIGIYSLIGVVTLYYSGSYDRPRTVLVQLKGWLFSILALLTFYSLLPEDYRFSRAVIVIGSASAFILSFLSYYVIKWLSKEGQIESPNRILVLGNSNSLEVSKMLLESAGKSTDFIAGLSNDGEGILPKDFIGKTSDLQAAVDDFKVDTLIIDVVQTGYSKTLAWLENLEHANILVLLLHEGKNALIGSHKILTHLEFESLEDLTALNTDRIVRLKRSFDIVASLSLITTLPLTVWFIDSKASYMKNLFSVTSGKRSWVGLDDRGSHASFPAIKKGILCSMQHIIWPDNSEKLAIKENVEYLSKYSIMSDIRIFFRHFHALGK